MLRSQLLDLAVAAPVRLRSIKMIIGDWRDPAGLEQAVDRLSCANPDNADLRDLLARATGCPGPVYEGFKRIWYRYPNAVRVESAGSPQGFPATWCAPHARPPPVRATVPDFSYLLGPLEGELLDPFDLLAALEFRSVAAQRFRDREVVRIHGVADWHSRSVAGLENLAPADSYDALLDSEVGILLRFSCLLDGAEISTRELLHVEVDVG